MRIVDGAPGFSATMTCKNIEQIYGLPIAEYEVKQIWTVKPGNTAVRGPGEPQSIFNMETTINRVAEELDISPHQVRDMNIFGDLAAPRSAQATQQARHREVFTSFRYW
jgi:CO/xanthine dehydrogenase Mo-binding subunit